MTRRFRFALAAGVAVLGVLGALFLGPGIAQCLGPLGVTGIECARATGWFPTVGPGTPILAGCLLLAVVIADPRVARPRALVLAAVGGVAAAVAYLAIRPTTWTGPTSTGQVISLTVPLDPTAVALVALVGGLAGLAVGRGFALRQRA